MPPRKPTAPKPPRRRKAGDGEEPTRRPRRASAEKVPEGILVTGAGGLVGRALVARLRQEGRRLVTLSRRPPASPSLPGEVHLTGDVCGSEWERWCEGCVAAVHLVGAPRPAPAADLEKLHVAATARIIEACRNLGIERLVTVSATGAAAEASSAFLRSKFDGEQLVEGSGLAWTVLRPTVVFGESDGFSTGLARLARRFRAFPIPGDGSALFQPVAAEDVAAALASLVDSAKAAGRTVELGGAERLTLDEVARRIAHAMEHRRPLLHVPLRFVATAFRLARRRPDPWLTDEALALLLSGSVADALPSDLDVPAPTRRFAGLEWLAGPSVGNA